MENLNEKPAPRLPLEMPIKFRRSYARQTDKGQLKNISLTGAFLQTTDPGIVVTDKIVFSINVSGRKRNIDAKVIWKNESGCGVQFKPFNNRDLQIVDDLMYFVENNRDSRKSVLDDIFKVVS